MVTVEKFINDLREIMEQSVELNRKIKLNQFKFDSMFRSNSDYIEFIKSHTTGKLGPIEGDEIFESKVSFGSSLNPDYCRIFWTQDILKEDWRFTDDFPMSELIKFLEPSENTVE